MRLFSSYKIYKPRWSYFLQPIIHHDSKLRNCENLTYSFVCFIGYDGYVFAITGGFGSNAIEPFICEDFGLQILVRLFEKNSKVVKSIQDRGVTGVVLGQTKFYRGDQRFSDENQFGKIFKQVRAELNKKILKKSFGFKDDGLKRATSACMAKTSFQINKAIDFSTLLLLIKRFSEILKQEENFVLNKVKLVSKRDPKNTSLIKALPEAFIEKIYQECKSSITSDVFFAIKILNST